MQYFLDKVLIFSLELDVTEIYCSFVEILENSDDLIQHAMAKKIGKGGCLYGFMMYPICKFLNYFIPILDAVQCTIQYSNEQHKWLNDSK